MNQRWEEQKGLSGGGEPWEDIPYFCYLVPSSSPDSAAWCCGQVGGFAYLSPGVESCVRAACTQ